MYFIETVIKKAFHKLKDIDLSNGKSRKEKISGLRYLLATSNILKKKNSNILDLSVGSELRADFISSVGDVIALDSNGLYSKDFFNEFDTKKDYGVGSNFLTTRLANSRFQHIKYPGRPAALLNLAQEQVSILDNVGVILVNYYNINAIKVPLCFWLMRREYIKIPDKEVTPEQIKYVIDRFLTENYTKDIVTSFLPTTNELEQFLSEITGELFSDNVFDTSLLVKEIKEQYNVLDSINEKVILNYSPTEDDVVVFEDNLSNDDPILQLIQKLLSNGAKGIIFSGPPGTSKTWYALKIAMRLSSNDRNKVERIQFHPSYSYEDFIEGLVPTGSLSGSEPLFKPKDKIFLRLCDKARKDLDNLYILIIDEFSRGEPSKIFGELLTYIEPDYRDIKFTLPYSEKNISIPQNVLIFATMNPYDRSVVELDSALERRFEIVEMNPRIDIFKQMVEGNGISGEKLGKIILFFNKANELTPHGFGHTYFRSVETDDDLILLWNHKLKFIFSKLLKFNPESYDALRLLYINILDEQKKELIK